jgi:Protein of unknown function (DUF3558)
MRHRAPAILVVGLVVLTLCSKPSPAQRGPDGGSVSSDMSSIDACTLLTPAEIQQTLGVAMKPGVKQTTDNSSQCQWDSQNESDAVGVSVSVATYDDRLYHTMSSAQAAKPVSGFGEAAYKDYPHGGDIAIKHDGHEIDIGVVDFKLSNEKLDAAAATFAKLVLARVS